MKFHYSSLSKNKCLPCWFSIKSFILVICIFLLTLSILSLNCQSSTSWTFMPTVISPLATDTQNTDHSTIQPLPIDSTLVHNQLNKNESRPEESDKIGVVELKWKISYLNDQQVILNSEKYGPVTNDTVVIVIQAYNRLMYLQALIDSLQKNRFIEDTLLVFSHGFYSEEINLVVQNIQFTRVMQIWFPFSLQANPNSFPGFSPKDCPHGINKEQFQKLNCSGKPRDVKVLQIKHHWWWKINTVFDKLRVTANFDGFILFLEEDHYVFPDLLHIIKLMKSTVPQHCPDCNVFGLGQNPRPRTVEDYKGMSHKVRVQQWNNMGFAFDKRFWRGLKSEKCSNMFCNYNDYNWDFTLAYLSHKCLPHEIKPLTVSSPRVFHIGDCGIHFHGKDCSLFKSLEKVLELQEKVIPYLFPVKLSVSSTSYRQAKIDGHNGGWDDLRDISLYGLLQSNDHYWRFTWEGHLQRGRNVSRMCI